MVQFINPSEYDKFHRKWSLYQMKAKNEKRKIQLPPLTQMQFLAKFYTLEKSDFFVFHPHATIREYLDDYKFKITERHKLD